MYLRHAQARAVLVKYDADNSGNLDLREFRALVDELRRFQMKQPTTASRPSDDIERSFQAADKDRSGGIDVNELHGALQTLGLGADMNQTRAVMGRYDADGDGTLDMHEYRRLVVEIRGFQTGGQPTGTS